jgi:hypothetical protein
VRQALFALVTLTLLGCSGEETSLFVELRTDLVAGAEFFAVEAVLDGSGRVDRPAIGSQDFLTGQRIAEFDGIEPGQHVVTVRLLDADGTEVAHRRTRVDIDGQLALTVLVSRDCRTITCGLEDTCVHGECISVDCHEELNPTACGTFECASDGDCAPPSASCATAVCDLGACLAAPVADACAAMEYCDVDGGCRMRGAPRDAAVDAIADTSVMDAGDTSTGDTADSGSSCGDFPGLLGYWTMDAVDVVDDQILDSSGNGHHGTWTGSPAPNVVAGRVGEAIDWAGTTNDFIDLPTTIPLNTAPSGFNTISMWYRRDGPDVDEALFFIPFDPATAPPRYGIWLNTDRFPTPVLCINTGSGECWGAADPTVIDRWVHIVVVFVNGLTTDGLIYMDGAPVTMSCVFGTCDESRTAGFPLTLGGQDSTYDYHGLIDDVRLYDRALTPAEVSELFACSD